MYTVEEMLAATLAYVYTHANAHFLRLSPMIQFSS